MFKDCVIFSSYIPSQDRLWVGEFYLNCLYENFIDCDVYIGINYLSCPEWVELVKKYDKLNITFSISNPELMISSDASGYQCALQLLKKSNVKYRTVLFLHTKGVSHECDHSQGLKNLEGIKNAFLTSTIRDEVKECFKIREIGLFSDWATLSSDITLESLDKLYDFWYSGNRFMIIGSIFYMKGFLVHQFIHNCNLQFLQSNLVSLGFDRYFFERDFPTICTRFGYEYKFKHFMSHYFEFNNDIYQNMLSDWRNKNELVK